jgi:hypothetical protein
MRHTVVKTMRKETRKKGLRYHYGLDCNDDWPKGWGQRERNLRGRDEIGPKFGVSRPHLA